MTSRRGPRAARAARVGRLGAMALALAIAAAGALDDARADAMAAPDSLAPPAPADTLARADSLAAPARADTTARADSLASPAPADTAGAAERGAGDLLGRRLVSERGPATARDEARMLFFTTVSFPASRTLARYWQTGLGLGGGFAFPVRRWLALTGNLALDHFQFDERAYVDDIVAAGGAPVSVSGFSTNVITALAGARLHGAGSRAIAPFVSVAAGVAYIGVDDGFSNGTPIRDFVLQDAPGRAAFKVGVGLRHSRPGRFGWLIEAGWVDVFEGGDDVQYYPVRLAVLFPEEIRTR